MTFKPIKVELAQPTSFTATDEQIYISKLLKEGKDIKVIAGAGAAKSSTLRYLAQDNPEKSFLVLCFNKANAVESNAHPDKPSNITYSTVHSLAYQEIIGKSTMFRKKLKFLDYADIEDISGITKDRDKQVQIRRAILDCVTSFCQSDCKFISDTCKYRYNRQFIKHLYPEEFLLDLDAEQIVELDKITERYWYNLLDKGHPAKISHDVYLKLYQLGYYTIDGYKVLCLDECQDTNPVTEAIFSTQTHLQRVIVGDPMQQLYAWRGAGQAMEHFEDFTLGYLTQSFRFGSNIADLANIVLAKNSSSIRIKGVPSPKVNSNQAILCRTNAEVLSTLLTYTVSSYNYKIYTSINIKETFSKLYHINSCWFDERPKFPNASLVRITNKVTLLEAMGYSEDIGNLNRLNMVIKDMGLSLTQAKKDIEAILVESQGEADICITTIHASKGMEYGVVRIAEDFISPKDLDKFGVDEVMEENESRRCLLYVALTRAQQTITWPDYLDDYLGQV